MMASCMKLEVTFLSNLKKQFITILKLENSNKLSQQQKIKL